MKKEFNETARKRYLYSGQAVVFTLRVARTGLGEGCEPARAITECLDSFDQKGIRYEVISREAEEVVFAVSRRQAEAAQKARDEYFSGPRLTALGAGSRVEWSYDPLEGLWNALMKPFSRIRREVSRAVGRLNGP